MAVYRPLWFQQDEAFDAEIRRRFGTPAAAARDGALDGWAATPEGLLALVLLLDQMPRNLFRGEPDAFASDPHARAVARARVLRDRLDLRLPLIGRSFLYLSFEHSEAMADHDLAVGSSRGCAIFLPPGCCWRDRSCLAPPPGRRRLWPLSPSQPGPEPLRQPGGGRVSGGFERRFPSFEDLFSARPSPGCPAKPHTAPSSAKFRC
jgi:hypothetical protein